MSYGESGTGDAESTTGSSGRKKKYATKASTTYELTGGGTLWETDSSKYGWDKATSDTGTVSRSSRGLYDDTGSSGFTSFGSTLKPTETTISSLTYTGKEPEESTRTAYEAGDTEELRKNIKKEASIQKRLGAAKLRHALLQTIGGSTGNRAYDAKIKSDAFLDYAASLPDIIAAATSAATETETTLWDLEQEDKYKAWKSEDEILTDQENRAWEDYKLTAEKTTVTTYGSTDEDKVTLDDYRIV